MDKSKLLYAFWNGFSWTAYDETSVPTGENKPKFPYITFEVATDNFENVVPLTASIWTRSASWTSAETKADEIENYFSSGGVVFGKFNSRAWFIKASPFRRRMGDESDDKVKRIVINYTVEFFC